MSTRTMLAGPLTSSILFAIARGVPPASITAATGLTLAHLADPAVRLPERHMPAIWRLMQAMFPNEPVSLEMAAAAPLSVLGAVAHAAQFAETIRGGVRLFVRYQLLFSPSLRVTLHEGPEETRLAYFHPQDAEDGGHASEVALGLGARFSREVLEADAPLLVGVEFAHTPFAPLEAYRDFFRAPVRFEAPRNTLILRSDRLDGPLPRRNPLMLRHICNHLDLARAALEGVDCHPSVVEVRAAAQANGERYEYSTDALATRLGVGLRSLQRQLQAIGTTAHAVIDEVREANAHQLLRDPRLSLADVAFLLGYATENSFRRAFKRWTGRPPRQVA
ncbi:MAG: AraC family transcriptional regulator ligand-binding domain-containing protein [Myxococcales bacterium]|nr:AraC family transcriptional regulator ligand-binding domain-containing protein [Myxococcales bacterium]